MPADKEWALMANYADKTLLRNSVAFELSRRLGMAYTPRSAFAEVFLNGGYLGTYLICESIKIAPARVNIEALAETDTAANLISGGYLLEVDARLGQPIHWRTQVGLPFNLHDPDPIAPEQLTYLKKYIQDTETALYRVPTVATGGYGELVDVGSLVNWYLVNELFRNNDAAFFTSVWLYKPRNQKLALGPVWDFDIAAGNINYGGNDSPTGWYMRNSLWLQRLFTDPEFVSRLTTTWAQAKGSIDSLIGYIDQQAKQLARAQDNNFRRWPILDQYVWPNSEVAGSYQGEIQFLENWLRQRIAWMDAQLTTTPN